MDIQNIVNRIYCTSAAQNVFENRNIQIKSKHSQLLEKIQYTNKLSLINECLFNRM